MAQTVVNVAANIAFDQTLLTPSTIVRVTYTGEPSSPSWLAAISSDCDASDTGTVTIGTPVWSSNDASCMFAPSTAVNDDVWSSTANGTGGIAMKCSTSGVKQLYVTRTATVTSSTCTSVTGVILRSTQFFTISPATGCYQWYIVTIPSSLTNSSTAATGATLMNVRIWAYDPLSISSDERALNATLPSATSAELTLELSSLGEVPSLLFYASLADANFDTSAAIATFAMIYDSNINVWTTSYTIDDTNTTSIYAAIGGRGIIIVDCVVSPLLTLLPSSRILSTLDTIPLAASSYTGSVALSMSYDISQVATIGHSILTINYDACSPSVTVAYIHGDDQWLFSPRQLIGLTAFNLPSTIGSTITDILFLRDTWLFITPTNVYWSPNINITMTASSFTPVPSSIPTRVSVTSSCDNLLTPTCTTSSTNGIAIAWATTMLDVFYISYDGGRTFTTQALPTTVELSVLLALTTVPNYVIASIWHVQRVPAMSTIAVMARLASSTSVTTSLVDSDAILWWSETTRTWSVAYLFTGPTQSTRLWSPLLGTTTPPIMIQSPAATGAVVMAGTAIYFSPNGGGSVHIMQLRSRTLASSTISATASSQYYLTSLSTTDYFIQVVMSYSGVVAAITAASRLFVFVSGTQYAVEIVSPVAASYLRASSWSLFIDPLSSLSVVYTIASAPYIVSVPIAWQPQISAAIIAGTTPSSVDVTCNYLLWQDDLNPTYYIDMARTVDMTLTLTIAAIASSTAIASSLATMNSLSLSVADTSRLQFNTTLTLIGRAEASSGGRSQTVRTVTLQEAPPSAVLATNETRRHRVARLAGTTSVRVAPAQQSATCTLPMEKVANVRIGCPPDRHIRLTPAGTCASASSVRVWPACSDTPVIPTLATATYDCIPLVYHQGGGWSPTFDLYDGDTFVETMPADYIIWELQGRTDWTYTASVGSVGCLSTPLSWSSLAAAGYNGINDWTPENQTNCYDSSGTQVGYDSSATYNVLNASGVNQLYFPLDGNDGLFVFGVRVVSPTYSYCTLTATFAIHLYGAPLSAASVGLIVLVVTLSILAVLALTYVYYRRTILLQKQADRLRQKQD